MKSLITHVVTAIVAVLLTMLMMSRCDRAATVTVEKIVYDTIVSEPIVEIQVDTFEIIKWRTRVDYDTIVRQVEIAITDTVHINDSTNSLYTYDQYYLDSTYAVSGNIIYNGEIIRHDQMFTQLKDKFTVIDSTTTRTNTIEITKITNLTRQPRFLLGAYSTFTVDKKLGFQQTGVNVTFVDNKFRQYTVGKSVLDKTQWLAEFKYPLFYSKPK